MDFSGKSVFVTGASSGLGKAIAIAVSKLKPKILVITGRSEERLELVKKEIQCECVICPADFSKPDEAIRVSEAVEKAVNGSLDVFIADHGYGGDLEPVPDVKVEGNFARVMQVNFNSIVALTNLLGKFMSENSSIVFITTLNSIFPSPCGTAYCCSKAALSMFMRCAAIDLGLKKQIRVNSVAPGFIDTPFQAPFFPNQEVQTQTLTELGKKGPLKRIATVEGIADIVLFYASDLARDITGQEQVVDCGASLMAFA